VKVLADSVPQRPNAMFGATCAKSRASTSSFLNDSFPVSPAAASGRVPVFATGHQQTAVRRTPDFRSCTTGMCCLAVIRRGLLVGAYRPEAVVSDLLGIFSAGPLWMTGLRRAT